MEDKIAIGTELLILKNPSYDKNFSRNMYYTSFIKGVVTGIRYEFDKYENESFKVYTVLGSDGVEYKGEYGDYSLTPDKYFFLTITDYKENLNSIMLNKTEDLKQIKLDLDELALAYLKISNFDNEKTNKLKK